VLYRWEEVAACWTPYRLSHIVGARGADRCAEVAGRQNEKIDRRRCAAAHVRTATVPMPAQCCIQEQPEAVADLIAHFLGRGRHATPVT